VGNGSIMKASDCLTMEVGIGRHGPPPPEPLDADVAVLARDLQRCAAVSDMESAREALEVFAQRCTAVTARRCPAAALAADGQKRDDACGAP
jgi:hypothetical protein